MRKLAFLLLAGLCGCGLAASAQEALLPEQAFRVGVIATAPDRIEVIFQVTPDYYLYRSKMKFSVAEGQPVALGTPDLPDGKLQYDEWQERDEEIYQHDVTAKLPVSRGSKEAFILPLEVSWQGCWEGGLCYLPTTKTFQVQLPEASAVATLSGGGSSVGGGGGFVSEQDRLAGMIRDGNIFLMAGAFFLAGLLLAFTPCVLPMVPIVAGIIAGEGANVTRARAFGLSLAYVLGMAATYTAAGVAFAAAGQQAQTLFQQPWIILLFSALFVAMALSMFGFFTVQMPAFVQTRLAAMSNQQRGGNYTGVVVMGALSALIVTTCVGPALVAALSVIGQSGEVTRGGVALFAMAIGMGMPLLAIGASAGQLLPRAGAWMVTVKQAMGALMLLVAVWMLSRILPAQVTMWLWIIPLLALALVFLRATFRTARGRVLARSVAVVVAGYALLIGIGAVRGATNPLQPLQPVMAQVELPFERIKSVEELNARIAAANAAGQTVMLDFYADWCVSCKEMEHYTFPQPAVRAALANTLWLQADVTDNDATDQALLQHLGVFAPPTIAFFGLDGVERSQYRVVGYMKAEEFALRVTAALQ
ncbi:MAG TPA: protein-disulfide reductase DsbD [Steroidobacteraceae bacterium]|nr:protein-disulfide reductase DsbD [Steroidobacteraceae bacterium]